MDDGQHVFGKELREKYLFAAQVSESDLAI